MRIEPRRIDQNSLFISVKYLIQPPQNEITQAILRTICYGNTLNNHQDRKVIGEKVISKQRQHMLTKIKGTLYPYAMAILAGAKQIATALTIYVLFK